MTQGYSGPNINYNLKKGVATNVLIDCVAERTFHSSIFSSGGTSLAACSTVKLTLNAASNVTMTSGGTGNSFFLANQNSELYNWNSNSRIRLSITKSDGTGSITTSDPLPSLSNPLPGLTKVSVIGTSRVNVSLSASDLDTNGFLKIEILVISVMGITISLGESYFYVSDEGTGPSSTSYIVNTTTNNSTSISLSSNNGSFLKQNTSTTLIVNPTFTKVTSTGDLSTYSVAITNSNIAVSLVDNLGVVTTIPKTQCAMQGVYSTITLTPAQTANLGPLEIYFTYTQSGSTISSASSHYLVTVDGTNGSSGSGNGGPNNITINSGYGYGSNGTNNLKQSTATQIIIPTTKLFTSSGSEFNAPQGIISGLNSTASSNGDYFAQLTGGTWTNGPPDFNSAAVYSGSVTNGATEFHIELIKNSTVKSKRTITISNTAPNPITPSSLLTMVNSQLAAIQAQILDYNYRYLQVGLSTSDTDTNGILEVRLSYTTTSGVVYFPSYYFFVSVDGMGPVPVVVPVVPAAVPSVTSALKQSTTARISFCVKAKSYETPTANGSSSVVYFNNLALPMCLKSGDTTVVSDGVVSNNGMLLAANMNSTGANKSNLRVVVVITKSDYTKVTKVSRPTTASFADVAFINTMLSGIDCSLSPDGSFIEIGLTAGDVDTLGMLEVNVGIQDSGGGIAFPFGPAYYSVSVDGSSGGGGGSIISNDDIIRIKKLLQNNTKIDTIAKTMTVFDDDTITPIAVYDLFDEQGDPTATSIFERKLRP